MNTRRINRRTAPEPETNNNTIARNPPQQTDPTIGDLQKQIGELKDLVYSLAAAAPSQAPLPTVSQPQISAPCYHSPSATITQPHQAGSSASSASFNVSPPTCPLTGSQPGTSVSSLVSPTPNDNQRGIQVCNCTSPPLVIRDVVPSDSLSSIDLVPEQLADKIRAGKYVNLAYLLTTTHDYEAKADSQAMQRTLSPREFSKAFRIFRNIMAGSDITLRSQMEAHEDFVLDLAAKYESPAYYQYHVSFAMRVASFSKLGTHIDWSKPDMNLFTACCAHVKRKTCSICHSTDHEAAECSRQYRHDRRAAPYPKAQHFDMDNKGRRRVFIEGREVCNHFNVGSCYKKRCDLVHVCLYCKSRAHGEGQCPMKVDRRQKHEK